MGKKVPSAAGNGPLLVKPSTWEALRRQVEGLQVIPDPEQFDVTRRGGKTFFRAKPTAATADSGGGGGDGALTGSFCRQYVIGEGLAGEGDTYLQGGTITGSNGTAAEAGVLDDYKVLDATTGVGSLAGDRLYLSCNVTATLANGIVQPGVLLNSAELTTILPTAHTFSTTALTGVIFVEIGRWTDTEFLPSGACGLSTVTGCPGSFSIT